MSSTTTVVRYAALLITTAAAARAQLTQIVSLNSSGAQGNNASNAPTISDDGRFIAFSSDASNLASVDTNNNTDAFVRDRATGTTILISEKFGSPGTTGNGASGGATYPRISGNGRYVVFSSGSTDLTSPPSIAALWRKDLVTGLLEAASVSSTGTVTGPPGFGYYQVSTTGRLVVFASSNPLVPGDTNNSSDIYIRDFQAGTTTRASLYSDGSQFNGGCISPSISDDGRWVLFMGAAPNLTHDAGNAHLLLKDMQSGALTIVDASAGGAVGNGGAFQPRLTPDGRYAVWQNNATNLYVDPFYDNPILLKDLTTGAFEAIAVNNAGTPADNTVSYPQISHDGRFVTYFTAADNLGVPLPTWGVALRDRVTHTTSIVSRSTGGAVANNSCQLMALSGDGRYVAFESLATNLDAVDTNANWDIYLRDRFAGGTFEYCVAQVNSHGCAPHMSASGTPSASSGSGFTLHCAQELNNKQGLLFYGSNGAQAVPFSGGFLCVRPPTLRTATQSSGGSASGTDCTGQFNFDFNVRIASGIDPNLTVGTDVAAQFWSRDPAAATTTNLSDAVRFTIKP